MKSNFRKYDLILILFFTTILILVLILEVLLKLKFTEYFIALMTIILMALNIHLIRSFKIELGKQRKESELAQKIETNAKILNRISDKLIVEEQELSDFSSFQTNLWEKIYETSDNFYYQIESLLSVYSIIGPVKHPLPNFRHWAISPDSMKIIIAHILKVKPKFILEFGSGTSSVIIGYCLKNLNHGKLLSLDHTPDFCAETADQIRNHGLQDFVEILYAPLKVHNFDGKDYLWYSTEFTNNMDKVDLMIIDGPPESIQKNSRYPALRLMRAYLPDSATIFLDDGNRAGEIEIVAIWLDENKDIKSKLIPTEKGLTVLQFV
jgi:hypothetical protein